MSDFPVLLLEGAFHKNLDGALLGSSREGTVVVSDVLAPFEGKRVRVAAHHLPLWPEPTKWGGGSCGWEDNGGHCPVGHHLRPAWLFNVSAEGVLLKVGRDLWVVEALDGSQSSLDLGLNLPGHGGRIAAAQLATVEEMRDILAASGAADMVRDLGVCADDLHGLMGRLRTITRGK